jgi:8-oxo-dGTP diphosphatase
MDVSSSPFSERLRLRACGLLVRDSAILLIKIHSPVTDQLVWMPPGGEIKFGESLKKGVKREFREETKISVEVGDLLYVNELMENLFHAVECYFEVNRTEGTPRLGFDPEFSEDQQLLNDLKWIPIPKLKDIRFVPPNLLKKLMHWEQRYSFPIFKRE